MLGSAAWGATADTQRALEQKFDAQLQASDLQAWMKQMSAKPTHVGAPHDKANAEFVQQQFRAWGWDAQIETFDVLYPTLKQHSLELVAPTHFVASLKEPPIEGDGTSTQTDGLPPYHAYGGDGDVTAPLVYVNFGMPDDYKELARRNIDVKGKIVIVRYGGGWRGLKPKLAQEHGAVGCLIYSDPHEDGYFAGDAYPKGGFRPSQGVQRGSVLDMPVAPGDPLTPGVGATEDAKRLKLEQAKTILKIPVMPISYGDAQPLLAALGGPVAPPQWRGALPITYHVGPGPATVHLSIQSDWSRKPALRRDREDSRRSQPRRVGRARQPSRRLGVRRGRSAVRTRRDDGRSEGDRRAAEGRLAAEAHARLRELGRARSRGCSARRNGPRRTPRSCSARPCSTSTPTATRAASSRPAAAIRCSVWSTKSRRT